MLEIKNMSKSYGKINVLTDINMKLEDNKIYGLLGRNGVGKTTLLNIIANQIKNDSGSLVLDGESIFENSKAVENICLVREKGISIDEIKVKKIFAIARLAYKDWNEGYKEELVKEFKLDVRKKYHKLSRGNQTIVGLIIGLASNAKLTIFDEPSLGLDAAFRYKFYDILMNDVAEKPRTVIISTHLIDEVTNLFEEVIILKDGRVFLKDEVSNLMKKGFFINGKEENFMPLIKDKNILHKEEFGSSVIVSLFDTFTPQEKQRLQDNNVEISSMPLQKLFVYLTESSQQKEVL